MDYGRILTRAWHIIWENKWLILLGMIVALGSGGRGGASSGGNVQVPSNGGNNLDLDMPQWDVPDLRGEIGPLVVMAIVLVLVLISLGVLVGIVLWIASTIARGGLIAGVSTIDGGGTSTFAQAWQAGWARGWRLLGIGVVPAIPGLMLLIAAVVTASVFFGIYGLSPERLAVPSGIGLGVVFLGLVCILAPISLVLSLLRTFANRACMLEDVGVIEAYRRGLQVLVANIGPAIILFLLQLVVSAVLGVAMILPGLVMVLCCLLWPILLAIKGAVTSYFSTMWTLAWREWTGRGHAGASLNERDVVVDLVDA